VSSCCFDFAGLGHDCHCLVGTVDEMSTDSRSQGLRLTICLGLFLFCDGFIHGSQMCKVKVQLTDTLPSSLIRRNTLHSETISNRPSSSLLAKQPAEPAFQEQKDDESFVQKNRVKSQNVIHKGTPRKAIERNVKSNSISDGNDDKVKRDLENLQHQDQLARQNNMSNERTDLSDEIGTFLVRLQQSLSDGKLKSFVKILKSLAMEGGNNDCLPQLVPLLEKIVVADLDSSMTADLIWSLGKLNMIVQNYEHKNVLMTLMNRFCEHEELSPREVTTSLVRVLKLASVCDIRRN
jgi:hypothetical protein